MGQRRMLDNRLGEIDQMIDDGQGSNDIISERRNLVHQMIEKRSQKNVTGVVVDEDGVTDPKLVKEAFREYYANKFKPFSGIRPSNRSQRYKSLSSTQVDMLEKPFSNQEIHDAVWACGCDKAPGPDKFSFRFLRKFWDEFQTEVVEFVHEFSDSGVITPGCNASFITLIPKCENPTLIKDFRPISLIGFQYKIIAKLLTDRLVKVVDSIVSPEQSAFIKGRQITDGALMAYDSLSWDYLDCMLKYMGFGDMWRKWIRGCLVSVRASVLFNGSPTKEFQLHKGLRQGDPLSSFLFILAMEGLHILTEDADRDNVECLIRILNIFYFASGLQLNLQKSKLYGIGVAQNDVQDLARCTGCGADSVPFLYLGLPVGERMYQVNSWTPLMAKFKKRLANWKSKLMSIGGRLTLVKSVLGSLGIYYCSLFPIPAQVNKQLESMRSRFFWGIDDNEKKIQWAKWDTILNSKEKGGLDVGSLWASNQALLFKWRWRFLNGNDMMWVKLIKSCHGREGGFLDGGSTPKSGVWAGIVKACMKLHTRSLVPNSAIKRKIGNGTNTSFWKEIWCGDGTLEATFPRLAALASNRNALVSDYWSTHGWNISWRRDIRGGVEQTQYDHLMSCLQIIHINSDQDGWRWEFDNEETFTVRSIRKSLDVKRLPAVELWFRIGVWLELDIAEFVNVEDMFWWTDGQG
ncbi:RNA-directed DNA polymerase, eukaryota, reverse transcriptase zinc-binding domain protein, partial [Tanacetum coccineum]